MKKVLLALLSLLPVTYSQKDCLGTHQDRSYYIYNVTVDTKAYYCSYSEEQDSYCKNFNGKIVADYLSDFLSCNLTLLRKLGNFLKLNHGVALCELPERVNLLKNIITVPNKLPCPYQKQKCLDRHISQNIFWNSSSAILTLLQDSKFAVFTDTQVQRTFIQNSNISLILTKETKFNGHDVWLTNYDDIIVSTKLIKSKRQQAFSNIKTDLNDFCQVVKQAKENFTNVQVPQESVPKTWYVYSFPTQIAVVICLVNVSKSCEELNIGKTVPKNNVNHLNQCMKNFYNTAPYKQQELNFLLCERSLEINLEKDTITQIPSECKYSEGICKQLNMFWVYTDRCNSIRHAYEGLEKLYGSERYVIQSNDTNNAVFLATKSNLCGQSVWYTNQNGLVASERQLQFSESNTIISIPLSEKDREINNMQMSVYYIMFVFLICLAWYVFNVTVNFFTLRKLNRTLPSMDKVCLIDCVSQSLTTRHLFFRRRNDDVTGNVTSIKASQLYESVDNVLYNR